MGFCSIEEAQVLTKDGFYHIWKQKVATGLTHTQAYDQTEQLHQRISLTRLPMYKAGIGSFMRQHWENKSRQRQQAAA